MGYGWIMQHRERRCFGVSSWCAKMQPMANEFADICRRLDDISEELTDLAIARLRDSIDAGGDELPVDEKKLNRARRAVEKARLILTPEDERSNF